MPARLALSGCGPQALRFCCSLFTYLLFSNIPAARNSLTFITM
jgi:hypothetical protein